MDQALKSIGFTSTGTPDVAEIAFFKLETARNKGSCLLAIGWGAGFLSKSAAIGEEFLCAWREGGVHPVARRALRGATEQYALQFEICADQVL